MSIQVNRSPCYCTEIQGFSPLGTSNDKAGYTVTFWFDSINVCCSQKGRKKKEGKKQKNKSKHRNWLHVNFYCFHICLKTLAPLKHEASMHLHHSNLSLKRQPPCDKLHFFATTTCFWDNTQTLLSSCTSAAVRDIHRGEEVPDESNMTIWQSWAHRQ